jgi:hypothetical protein
MGVVGGPGPSTRYVPVPCDPSPCPPCRASTWAGGEKPSPFFCLALASTGHRGRVDARGRPIGGAPGLTRTSDRGAGAPSREGRCRAPSARAWLRDAKRRAIVHHEKERSRSDRSFASGPVPGHCAGRGHRRGLDGPSMPKPQQKIAVSSLNTPRCWRGRVGRGLDRREPGRSGWKPPVRQPRPLNAANMASARRRSKLRNPRNPSRPGEDSGARERRAKPLPTLPHTAAAASAKRNVAVVRSLVTDQPTDRPTSRWG